MLEGVEMYLKNFAQDESRWKSGWKLVGETIRSKRDWEFGEILQLQERERGGERYWSRTVSWFPWTRHLAVINDKGW